jgi:probable HAF family extracellular repeat protein
MKTGLLKIKLPVFIALLAILCGGCQSSSGPASPQAAEPSAPGQSEEPPDPAPTADYVLTDLGTLGGAASSAKDINNLGEVVGWSDIAGGQRRAFLYRDGMLTNLGTHTGGSYSEATAISDNGHVVGISGINLHGPQFREFMNGFLWQAGTLRVLTPTYCGCSFTHRHSVSAGYDVNQFGHAAGMVAAFPAEGTDQADHAALWKSWQRGEDLGIPFGPWWETGRAFGINDAGQVIGDYRPVNSDIHERRPFVWRDGIREDLGRLTGHHFGSALGINGSGTIVGWSGSPGVTVVRAVLWRDGGAQDLGTLSGHTHSQALDINTTAQVVGWSGPAIDISVSNRSPGSANTAGSAARAFLWRDNQMLDLNDRAVVDMDGTPVTGWVLTEAAAINDAGQIVGTGTHNGEMRGFLLTPVAAD